MRRLALGKTFQPPSIHEKNVEPVVVVVIVESGAAARRFQKIFVFVFAAIDGLCVEAGFAGDVEETDTDFLWRRRIGIRMVLPGGRLIREQRARERQDAFERQDERGTAKRLKKNAARRRQMESYLPWIGSC